MYILREEIVCIYTVCMFRESDRRNRKLIGALYKFRLTADERSTATDREEITSVVTGRDDDGKRERAACSSRFCLRRTEKVVECDCH